MAYSVVAKQKIQIQQSSGALKASLRQAMQELGRRVTEKSAGFYGDPL